MRNSFVNRPGVVYNAEEHRVVFAEDMNAVSREVKSVAGVMLSTYFIENLDTDLILDYATLKRIFLQSNSFFTSLAFPNLESVDQDIDFTNGNGFTSLDFSALVSCASFIITTSPVASLNLASLQYVSGALNLSDLSVWAYASFYNLVSVGSFTLANIPNMSSISLLNLTTCGSINISNLILPTVIDLTNLSGDCANVSIRYNANLSTIWLPLHLNCLMFQLDTNALMQSCVDDILAKIDGHGLSNGVIQLTGGTNESPSSAGLISKANLEAKGWTIDVV
jgi:hypothetical protein